MGRLLKHSRVSDPRPPSQAPPDDVEEDEDWPVNGQIPVTYCLLPDIA